MLKTALHVSWPIVLTLIGGLSALPAYAEENQGLSPKSVQDSTEKTRQESAVDNFVGTYGTKVKILVPPFRGLEPKLGLTYESSVGDGLLGPGWAFEGLGSITRAAPRRGAPKYNSADIYLLDGEEMIPCTTLGGTHCTKLQSFLRITYDAGANTWYAYQKDGTRLRFGSAAASRVTTAKGVFRWLLDEKRDPRGNVVTYGYWTDTGVSCGWVYPDQISYNGTTVQFYRAPRATSRRVANGACAMEMRYYINTIDVRVSGGRVRAYQLGHHTSTGSARPLLTWTQQWGSDATVDANGTVSGPSAMPASTYAYQQSSGASFASGYTQGSGSPDVSCDEFVHDGVFAIDMNGDNRADLVQIQTRNVYDGEQGYMAEKYVSVFTVRLNQGNGTYAPVAPGFCPPGGGGSCLNARGAAVGDFTGDGKPDVVFLGGWPRVQTFAGNGDGTFASTAVTSMTGPDLPAGGAQPNPDHFSSFAMAANLDNDGYEDLVQVTMAPGPDHCNLGLGSYCVQNVVPYLNQRNGSFAAAPLGFSWGDGSARAVVVADFTGDGLADLGHFAQDIYGAWPLTIRPGLGDGSFGAPLPATGPEMGAPYLGEWAPHATDLNGDGLADLIINLLGRPGSGEPTTFYPYLSQGDGSFAATTTISERDLYLPWQRGAVADADADGVPDAIFVRYYPYSGIDDVRVHRGTTPVTDVVTSVVSPLGGTETVQYGPSTAYTNTFLPFVHHVVTSRTEADGRGWSKQTTYAYAGGLWNAAERRFLGFRSTRVTDPTGAYAEHFFTQNVSDPASRLETSYSKDAAGNLYKYDTFTYARSGDGTTTPYVSLPNESWSYTCNGDASCKRTLKAATYDSYGNETLLVEHGDYDVTGDERTTTTTYYPNTSGYLVGLPGETALYEGSGTGGTRVELVRTGYDGQAYNVPPTAGNATSAAKYIHQDATWATTTRSYDAFGNATRTVDPRGNASTAVYDATYRLYPTSETNAVGHLVSRTWDAGLGVPTSKTDPNQQVTSWGYDPLGRVTRESRPDASYTTAVYVNFGSPTTQYVQLDTSAPTGTLWSRLYFDGMVRTWTNLSEGRAGVDATTLKEYDARGYVLRESAPYFAGETVRWTSHLYDPIGRETRTTNPDGTFRYKVFGADNEDWKDQNYDELGKVMTYWADGYGRNRQTRESIGGASYDTQSSFDRRGRLIAITDSQTNTTTMTWDALGRKRSMTDPDMGTWTYDYDLNGNITRQTDARGTTLSQWHDALNRLTLRQQGTTTLATMTYDQVRSGYYNVGHQTTMTDPSGTTTRDRDKLGRLGRETRVIDGVSYTAQWSYDSAGRLAAVTYPDNEVVSYVYDAAGNLTRMGGYLTGATYDARQKMLTRTFGNGVLETFTYSPTRFWLTGKTVTKGGVTIDNLSYDWDGRGEITAKGSTATPEDAWTYGYDDVRRLTQAANTGNGAFSQAFTYNAIGNMLSQTGLGSYTYPANGQPRPHAPLTAGPKSFTYDANGNRLTDGTRTITYDAENKMASDGTRGYVYDGEGKRVKAGGNTFVGKLFVKLGGGVTRNYYLYGTDRMARKDQSGVVSYYHSDHLGTPRKLTDASGLVVRASIISPFGKDLTQCGTGGGQAGEAESFTGTTFPPAGWTTGGNANWTRTTSTYKDSPASAASGTISHNQSTWLDTDVTFGAGGGSISFYWKVSSQSNYDYLLFCVDNDGCTRTSGYDQRISGSTSWAQVTKTVGAGTHSFRWVYAKNASTSSGSDKGWVDQVTYTGAQPPAVCGNGTIEGSEQCEAPFGTCCDSATCQFKSAATTCRPAAGECDAAELCPGNSAACPADGSQPNGTPCTGGTCLGGICQAPAVCGNGELEVGEQCEAPFGDCCDAATCQLKSAATVCRPAAGQCDAAELCTGATDTCPADLFQPDGTVCDVGTCQGGLCRSSCGIPDGFGLAGEWLDESGLYSMGARYHDPVVAQFTQPDWSADPDPRLPQKLNRYAYCYNNPIKVKDPTGLGDGDGDGDGSDGAGPGDPGGPAGHGPGPDSNNSQGPPGQSPPSTSTPAPTDDPPEPQDKPAASVNAMAQQNQEQSEKSTPPTAPPTTPAPAATPAPQEEPVAPAVAAMSKAVQEIADKMDFLDKNMVPLQEQKTVLEPMFERYETARSVVVGNIVGIQGKPASHRFSEKNPAMQNVGKVPGAQALAAKHDARVDAREAIGRPMSTMGKFFSAVTSVIAPIAAQLAAQAIVAESYSSSFGFGAPGHGATGSW